MEKMRPSRRIALSAMTVALTVLFLYGSEVLTGFRLILCFLCSLMVQVLLCEGLTAQAWLSFLASALLGFVLCPDRISWFFYVALLGHYGMIRGFFHKYVTVPWLRSLFTVLYCNGGVALAIWALNKLAGVSILSFLPSWPPVLLILLAEICFFLLDVLYESSLNFYKKKIRRHIIGKG